MRRFPFDTIAWMSGALLYLFVQLYAGVAALALLALLELFEVAPRVALVGVLGLVVSPAVIVTWIFHGADRTLASMSSVGGFARRASFLPSAEAWWAGASAWLILLGASAITTFVMMVISPPEQEMTVAVVLRQFAAITSRAQPMSLVRDLVWIASASLLYGAERAAKNDLA